MENHRPSHGFVAGDGEVRWEETARDLGESVVPFVNRLPRESQTHFNSTLRTKYFRKITKAVFNQRCLRTKPVEMHRSAKKHCHHWYKVSHYLIFLFNSILHFLPSCQPQPVQVFIYSELPSYQNSNPRKGGLMSFCLQLWQFLSFSRLCSLVSN